MTALRMKPLRKTFGWCDAADDRNYNRKVSLPYPASAERLWRNDHLYDVIVVLDYNITVRTHGRGSAIFLHVARRSFAPTAGCIAMKREHLLRLLAVLRPGTVIAAGKNLKSVSADASGSNKDRPPAFRERALWRRSSPRASGGRHGGGPRR